ncbi:NAD-dependent epimerase/dehydratase family protein [Runella sp.]|uniref:NAD-dependent epimerase/dehydratase family protein n=1 Tax=Runella sp. TaxID=1960881 RepID=UPI003D14FFC9
MTVLITGGSGFIGTNLIDLLIEQKYGKIINYDKNPPINPKQKKLWVEGNIMDENQLERVFADHKPEIIIHLAARTDTLSDVLEDYVENHVGTQHVLNVIKKSPFVKHVIVTSTQYVYKSEEAPLPTKMDDFKPHTIYGQSKVLTEQYTHNANLTCKWTIVRPTNIWGPWHMRYPNELWKVIDKGMYFHPVEHEVIRTYGYVKNIVHQIYQILIAPTEKVNHKMFYIGDEPIDSYIWLNELSLQLTGKKIKRIPKFIFQGAALAGDILRKVKIPFPLYTKRFNNMIEDYPAPTKKTIDLFGPTDSDIKKNVEETIRWIKTEGKDYFEYWKSK